MPETVPLTAAVVACGLACVASILFGYRAGVEDGRKAGAATVGLTDLTPMPSGCVGHDHIPCTQTALVAWLDAAGIEPEPFLRHFRGIVRDNPVTHNQRKLLTAVLTRCVDERIAEPDTVRGVEGSPRE